MHLFHTRRRGRPRASFHGWLVAALAALAVPSLQAKPIAYMGATTAMVEIGGDTMLEAQAFHAPRYWLSAGGGWLRMEAHDETWRREIAYARVNLLARRWNLPGAQGNVFVWGGLGSATGNDFDGRHTTPSAGFSADYETLRIYTSLRSEYHYNRAFMQRMDTAQVGFAPYKHDYERLATWVLLQARHATGDLMGDEVEFAAMLRFFKNASWLEAGLTQNGRLQAMLMFTF